MPTSLCADRSSKLTAWACHNCGRLIERAALITAATPRWRMPLMPAGLTLTQQHVRPRQDHGLCSGSIVSLRAGYLQVADDLCVQAGGCPGLMEACVHHGAGPERLGAPLWRVGAHPHLHVTILAALHMYRYSWPMTCSGRCPGGCQKSGCSQV